MNATPTNNTVPLKTADFNSLAEALDYAAQGVTGYNFYSRKGELYAALPYSQLRKQARTLARKLLSTGIERGSCMAIVATTDPDFVRFFFACQYAGIVPVPLPAGTHLNGAEAFTKQLSRLLTSSGARMAVSSPPFFDYLKAASSGKDLIKVSEPADFDALGEADVELEPLGPEELAYLQFTSGSTRFPKGVMITEAAVVNNLAAITGPGIRIQQGDRAVSWLPLYHDMGLVGLLLASMACQISVDLFSTIDFIMRPRLWLKLMSENRGTVSFGPPFAYELATMRLSDSDVAEYDLSSWRIAGIGADMIRNESLDKFAKKLAPAGFSPSSFIPCYGMAECSLAVTFEEIGRGVKIDMVDTQRLSDKNEVVFTSDPQTPSTAFVRCGKPLPTFEVEIRDSHGKPVEAGNCGTLFLKGPSIMTGYYDDPESTAEVLSEDGWLNTGDMAYMVDGSIVIIGRSKDLIIINGRNVWPQDLEIIAESASEVRSGDACAFSLTDIKGEETAVLLVQTKITDPDTRTRIIERIRKNISQELGIDVLIELVPRNTLVRTSSGKLSRSGTRKVYLQQKQEARMAA